jgi:hypothetical protein
VVDETGRLRGMDVERFTGQRPFVDPPARRQRLQ